MQHHEVCLEALFLLPFISFMPELILLSAGTPKVILRITIVVSIYS